MTAVVLRADARHLPLPDGSVDLLVTSPPYFALRDYRDGDGSLTGQIGAEATPGEYVEALLGCTREWMRVLKSEGSLWINLGDKYATADHPNNVGDQSPLNAAPGRRAERSKANRKIIRKQYGLIRQKSLIGLPWRYALGCIDDLGLILRAEIIWAKPNGLPESVTDRVRRSHEHWFHLVKQPRYYSAVDEIREPQKYAAHHTRYADSPNASRHNGNRNDAGNLSRALHPLGALPGSVWEVATQPLKVPPELAVDHFAAFPCDLVKRIVLGWSPPGICLECGEGRTPVADRSEKALHRPSGAKNVGRSMSGEGREREKGYTGNVRTVHRITGYACACPTPATP